jgi:Asp-tRNA(Asn)/Glu-tRNA(Gln) amidotransferase A subunit family amidase
VPSEKRGLGWSCLPVLGPMARNVPDTALLLSAMASDDADDPLAYTLHARPGARREGAVPPRAADRPVHPEPRLQRGLRLGAGRGTVRAAFREVAAAASKLFRASAEAHPDCTDGDMAFEVLRAGSFLHSHLEKVQKRPEDVGPNVRANVEEGLRYNLNDHVRAAAAQTRIYRGFQRFFERHDVLITPAITISPRPWRELYPAEIDGKPTRTYFHWLALAYYVTLSGHPAISLPVGTDSKGMPFGLQIVGPRGGDAFVLGVAAALEEAFASDPGAPPPRAGRRGPARGGAHQRQRRLPRLRLRAPTSRRSNRRPAANRSRCSRNRAAAPRSRIRRRHTRRGSRLDCRSRAGACRTARPRQRGGRADTHPEQGGAAVIHPSVGIRAAGQQRGG